MAEKPGEVEVMGYLAYGHPFLDGNGRTIMLIHAELARRAGIGIDWAATDKDKSLAALTEELEEPGKGKLDAYLKPFIRKGSEMKDIAGAIKGAPGLDGGNADTVAGDTSNPTLKAKYEAQELNARAPRPDLAARRFAFPVSQAFLEARTAARISSRRSGRSCNSPSKITARKHCAAMISTSTIGSAP